MFDHFQHFAWKGYFNADGIDFYDFTKVKLSIFLYFLVFALKSQEKKFWLYFICNGFRSKKLKIISSVSPAWFWPWF